MTNWLPIIKKSKAPLYIEIADAIEQDIENGVLVEGSRLPPVRNVAFDINVTVGTVSRAYKLACERGLVSGEVGRGTYVLQRGTHETAGVDPALSGHSLFTLSGHFDEADEKTKYHFGYSSAVDVGQSAIIAEAAGRIANGHPSKIMDYIRHVPDEWREAGAQWLATPGWKPKAEDVIATNGAHAAVIAIISALTAPGDKIAFEALTYCSIARSATLLGRRVVQVEFDKSGIIPESFERICAQQHPKILYLMPSVQNPTLSCLPEERRRQIAEIAHRYSVWIIDDAIYAPLVDDATIPFSAIAPELAFRVGGFSKSVSAGIRSGWCACPPRYAERIANAHKMVTGGASYWLVELASTLVLSGAAEAIRQKIRIENEARTAVVREVMNNHKMKWHKNCPYIWIKLPDPWTSGTFKSALLENNIVISNEDEFKPSRTDKVFHGARIAFTSVATASELVAPFKIIRNLLDSGISGYDNHN